MRATLNTETENGFRFMGVRGILEIHGVENPRSLTCSMQDGLHHGPCTSAWPSALRSEYGRKWRAEHEPKPETQKIAEGAHYSAPPGYDDTRDHLWNLFPSVKTRRPSIDNEVFGNNASIAVHKANYSYFNQSAAVWNASAQRIRS